MADTATLIQMQDELRSGDKIRVTLINGHESLGDFGFVTDIELHMIVRDFGRATGRALLIDGIKKIEKIEVTGPCTSFAGSGARCETCRYRKSMH